MFPKSSKILITGATGFIGGYILRKLSAEGYNNMICIKRSTSPMELVRNVDSVSWVTGDIQDICFLEEVANDVDIIIHTAADVSFDPRRFKQMLATSMAGTANLVNVALDNGISKFIHLSSVAAIGRRKKEETITEKDVFSKSQYDTTYGLSKFLAEQEVWRANAEGLNTTILNPSMVLGAGRWQDSSVQIFKKIFDGLRYYPSGMTGWVDVRDVADAVVRCLTPDLNGERFIISGTNGTYQSIFEKIAKHLNVSPPKKSLSNNMGQILWRLEALRSRILHQKPIITKETVISMSALSQYDNERSLLGLQMTYTPLDKTIAESSNAFLQSFPHGLNYCVLDV